MSEALNRSRQLSGEDVIARLMRVERAGKYLEALHLQLRGADEGIAGLVARLGTPFSGYKMPGQVMTPNLKEALARHGELFARTKYAEVQVPRLANRVARYIERVLKPAVPVQSQPLIHVANAERPYFQTGYILRYEDEDGQPARRYTIGSVGAVNQSHEFSGQLAAVRDNDLLVASDELDAVMYVPAIDRQASTPDPDLRLSIEYPQAAGA